jgi:hypothetical protein
MELTPAGKYVRDFTGGQYVSSRLISVTGLAFHPEGRLLAGSCAHTDAILAFSDSGKTVRRYVDTTCYDQMCVGPDGRLYVAGGWEEEKGIQVYGCDGKETVCVPSGRENNDGVAVDNGGNLYIADGHARCVRVYDSDFRPVRKISGSLGYPYRLAADGNNRLYVLEGQFLPDGQPCPQRIRTFDTVTRREIFSILPPENARLTSIAAGSDGRLWAAGYTLL